MTRLNKEKRGRTQDHIARKGRTEWSCSKTRSVGEKKSLAATAATEYYKHCVGKLCKAYQSTEIESWATTK